MKLFLAGNSPYDLYRVYGEEQIGALQKAGELSDTVLDDQTVSTIDLADVEIIFSTWGMPVFSEEIIDRMTNLKAIFYAASSVKAFAEPYLKRGVKVITAAFANGEFVTDFTLAQIFLCGKNYYRHLCKLAPFEPARGSYRLNVGVIGFGSIGKNVVENLIKKGHRVKIYDPYLKDERFEKATLEEIFADCDIVTNHAPDIPETRGMITKDLFLSMKKGAYFINTGRGRTVDEDGMASAFHERFDLTALLDVTVDEPPKEDSPLLKEANILLTPHIAGALGAETTHMADYCIEAFQQFLAREPIHGEVTLEQFARLS